ncbi:MAG: serine hydrolase [Planctomycetes bacterium]|nr:serine hydrolase [Planctomycetota bacterium]
MGSAAPSVVPGLCLAAVVAASGRAQTPKVDARLAEVAAAYAAKVAASAIFVSGRSLDSVLAEELAPDRPLETLIRPLLHFEVDADRRAVTCQLGPARATAVATVDLGCTLTTGSDAATLAARKRRAAAAPDGADPFPWLADVEPVTAVASIDTLALQTAVDAAFAEPERGAVMRTRAIVVVCRGHLVAERYAPGVRRDMRLPGWSMTKTIVDALVGVRVRQGAIEIDAPLAVPEWRTDPADPRAVTRLDHLLTMTSGLRWNEDYDDANSDALRMLFASADHAATYAAMPQVARPGEEFLYASGCTNLICRILRSSFASDEAYFAFPHDELFVPLGMKSALVETDPSGTFVGSSYGFATARDWARFGLLYTTDGTVGGRRILPEGWTTRSATRTTASRGRYGSHVGCNVDPDGDGPAERTWPDLPADLLLMSGHEGQYVAVFPTEQIVVVRLGCTKSGGFDLHGLLRRVVHACTPNDPTTRREAR